MENIKTISAIVSGGKVILDFPELIDGTEIILKNFIDRWGGD